MGAEEGQRGIGDRVEVGARPDGRARGAGAGRRHGRGRSGDRRAPRPRRASRSAQAPAQTSVSARSGGRRPGGRRPCRRAIALDRAAEVHRAAGGSQVLGVGSGDARRSRRSRCTASAAPATPTAWGSISAISSAPRRRRPGTPLACPRRSSSSRRPSSACRVATTSLPVRRAGDPALVAVLVELARPGDAEPRLERPGLVVDARVDDAARVAGLVGGDRRLALEHGDPEAVVAQGQLARDREADDPGADDDEVAFAGRSALGMHAARLAAWRCRSSRRSTPARALPQAAAHRRRLGLRAQVRRLPGARLRRRRRALPAVADRPAPGPLFPRARVSRGPLRDRRRAADPRRRRARDLRRAPEPPPPGRVASADARRGDAGAVPRLRPARGRRRERRSRARSSERRAALEELLGGLRRPGSVELTPLVDDPPRPSHGSRPARG